MAVDQKHMSLDRAAKEVRKVLRPYQHEVVDRMVNEKRHLNYLDMGMGKSLVSLLAVIEAKAFPCMIVASKAAMYVLEEELRKWFGEEAIIYAGKPKHRQEAFKRFAEEGRNFIITNYALAEELGQQFGIIPSSRTIKGSSDRGTRRTALTPHPGTKWKVGALIADEIQTAGLFNHKTKTYKVFKQLAKAIPYVYLLTGTPYRRGVIDFYAPLSLVDPVSFNSYWKYVQKYCRTIDNGFGKEIERTPKNLVEFRKMIRKYASIMSKEDYVKDLPEKTRITVPVVMDPEQSRVYNELTENLFAETDTGELIMSPGALAASVRQRQILVAPQSVGLKTRGAAIEMLLEMAEPLVEKRDAFVVFTPFRDAVAAIAKAIREKYPNVGVYQITGGLKPEEFRDQWQGFQNGRGARVLVCVIRSGASFHATEAATAFFLGYEWDFNQNTQAEDRLNRIGQKRPVTCYYFMHKDTIDEDIALILNDKKYTGDLVLSSDKVFELMINRRRKV